MLARTETHAPWDKESTWHILYKAVQQHEKLPRDLTLSPANISAHHSTHTLPSFLLLHTTILLSKIILHREWLPFLAIRATSPTGPLDLKSPFMANAKDDEYRNFGFWGQSAGELFETAKNLLSLLSQCSEYKALVETPLVGFATYMVALVGIYSTHFPWMDVREQMSTNPASSTGNPGTISMFFQREPKQTRAALDLLCKFRPRLRQTLDQMQVLAHLHAYYLQTKREMRKNYRNYNPFAPDETYKGKTLLMPLKMGEEEYGILDAILGTDFVSSSGDTEMVDASASSHHTPSRQHEIVTNERVRTPPHNAMAAAFRWPSVNFGGQQGSPTSPAINGTASSGFPSTHSAATSLQPFTPSAVSNGNRIPTGNGGELLESPANATLNTAGSNWTRDQLTQWLHNLETVFSANDIVGWAEGRSWREGFTAGSETGWSMDWRRLI
jgi:hypothetical protein